MPMPPSAERERQPERPSRYQPGDLDLRPFVEELEKSFGNRRGEYLLPALLQFGPRGADDELHVAAAASRATDTGLLEHPLDPGVE